MKIHLIANAHLDPVWLWDWREGLNEGLTTVKTILDLMDELPDLRFTRGEALIYQHIEETDPAVFRRIQKAVEAGRWDVVGGTYLQADTNLASIETLARQFTRGQRYFRSRFGRCPRVAWQADSFGHSAGLPEVLSAAGIEFFAFTRPDSKSLPLPEPAFWWEGPGGARVLAYRPLMGWYGSERDEMPKRLDGLVAAAQNSGLETVGCFYGLGNHGGGPSRRQVQEIQEWARRNREHKVIHSGLHEFFDALAEEVAQKPELLPTHCGELNFCLRGCYSSAARLKFLYRQSEAEVNRAERTDSVIAAYKRRPGADLSSAWDGLLFNSFHDILPGSSIERALEDQVRWLGGVIHSAKRAEFKALNELAALVDTSVRPAPPDHPTGVAALIWNPHSCEFRGHIELEACIDYRPAYKYQDRPDELPLRVLSPAGEALAFQELPVENKVMPHLPWRKRVLVPVALPAFGWNVLEMAWVEGADKPESKNPVLAGADWLDNGTFRMEAAVGGTVQLFHKGRPVFGQDGLSALVVEDAWGCWGGALEQAESLALSDIRERLAITACELLEAGPERGKLWVRFSGARSRMDLTFSLCREREAVDVQARIFWDEPRARLKINFPVQGDAEFEVPGAVVKRSDLGEVPGGRWVRVGSPMGGFGFASDALYNFSRTGGHLQATVVRGGRYAQEYPYGEEESPWIPVLDQGELAFRFLMTHAAADLPKLAKELEEPPIIYTPTPTHGHLGRSGSLAALTPASLNLLTLKKAEDGSGFVLRVQAPAGALCEAELMWMGQTMRLGQVLAGQIVTWKLEKASKHWESRRVDLAEEPVRRQPKVVLPVDSEPEFAECLPQ